MPVMEAVMERWMGRNEAAAYLKVSVRTFDRLVREGKVHKFSATGRRQALFDRQQLDAYVQSQRQKP